ncbi:hypothetical protein PYK22_00913 [Pyrinomonas methylaliphatogenes]|jgi:hypothetical protein|uniref:Uncharacterized protein n=1 Tax=Pyrinomonas methylaliphatogenes TaxID=454194 RepID=A0A0B6WUK4_9BACT|nr:hypothetical protein PYK22_00913 [Pyrinomonas methylaliphatogenes]
MKQIFRGALKFAPSLSDKMVETGRMMRSHKNGTEANARTRRLKNMFTEEH